MTYVIKTYANNNKEFEIRRAKTKNFLQYMQEEVCGYIEKVATRIGDEYFIICDDEGAIKGKPYNPIATYLMSDRYIGRIKGDALIVKLCDNELVPLEDEDVQYIMNCLC